MAITATWAGTKTRGSVQTLTVDGMTPNTLYTVYITIPSGGTTMRVLQADAEGGGTVTYTLRSEVGSSGGHYTATLYSTPELLYTKSFTTKANSSATAFDVDDTVDA